MSEREIYEKLAKGHINKKQAMEMIMSLLENDQQQFDENKESSVETATKSVLSQYRKSKNKEQIIVQLLEIFENILHTAKEEIDVDEGFKELGVDSINGVEIVRDINKAFNLNLDTIVLYDYSNISYLSGHVFEEYEKLAVELCEGNECKTGTEITADNHNDEYWKTGSIKESLADILSNTLHVHVEDIDNTLSFKDMGIDSINGVEIIRDINKSFNLNLDTVVLYDHSNLVDLAEYVCKELKKLPAGGQIVSKPYIKKSRIFLEQNEKKTIPHDAELQNRTSLKIKSRSEIEMYKPKDFGEKVPKDLSSSAGEKLTLKNIKTPISNKYMKPEVKHEGIAVIGMSGRYPGAKNLTELWSLLEKGIDAITEVPKERWDIDKYYDADPQANNKTNCRFGGFLKEVDKFDPIFFNISPMEAELMDPQQRIFLEEVWNAIEDAGYSDSTLAEMKCGVFAGATHGDYRKIMERAGTHNHAYAFTGLSTFVLTGRVSYVLNITGPNMAIDTACSSSLVAISQACQSITDGDCEMAIAGGIRLMLEPDLHIQTSKLEMLSTEGKLKSFDKDAEGLVLGEGVGVVVLKSVDKAIKDKDNIYGVIRAWGVNQDGKTNGITAPSAQSQERLISGIYEKFNINPASISYIEANGTASKLGDAMEIKALTDVFKKYTNKKNFCHIGTCKANIGHSTMASGVAGLIKVLLSMKNRKIPGLLNFKHENEHIDLNQSPFVISANTEKWDRINNEPLMAAVSSFGLSGTNSHIVISEAPDIFETPMEGKLPYHLLIFSAKTEKALRKRFENLLECKMNNNNESIDDIAFTLMEGRSRFKIRAAIVARDLIHLREVLKEVLEKGCSKYCLFSDTKEAKNKKDYLLEELGQKTLDDICNKLVKEDGYDERLFTLAQLYVKGYDLNFACVYADKPVKKVSLPGYPFAKERYWVAEVGNQSPETTEVILHPLIHKNTSTLEEQKYDTVFSGKEYYFTHHLIDGKKVLPGVAYLEMARAAAAMALEKKINSLKGILWASPMVARDDGVLVHTVLFPMDKDIEFEIYSFKSEQRVIHTQGKVRMTSSNKLIQEFNIDEITKRCREFIVGDDYYSRFSGNDLFFGESFHSIKEICIGENEAISELILPSHLNEETDSFILHPSIMNGAVETLISLMGGYKEKLFMPLALEELNIWEEPGKLCKAYVRSVPQYDLKSDMRKFDMYLLNNSGRALVGFKNFSVKVADK